MALRSVRSAPQSAAPLLTPQPVTPGRLRRVVVQGLGGLALGACGLTAMLGSGAARAAAPGTSASPARATPGPSGAGTGASGSQPPLADGPVLVVGDSLSAEYGLRRGSGWVDLLGERLAAQKSPRQVINASISGDTTLGGRARLPGLLSRHQPALVIVELGSNDALRGLDLAMTEANLRDMLARSRAAGARTVLLGMMMPPNYGKAYGDRFVATFERAAQAEQAALVPFFLEGVAERPDWFQADRIHPNEAAQPRLFDNVWPTVGHVLGVQTQARR